MSPRELVVLGTASQVPTRQRNHNGYVLLWDGHGILFDPGEGTQRQMLRAGVSAHDLTRICVTHFHGDHSLGLAGVVQRINLDRVPHTVTAHYPAGGERFFQRLCYATAYRETARLRSRPVGGTGEPGGDAAAAPAGAPEGLVPVAGQPPASGEELSPDGLGSGQEAGPEEEPLPFSLFAHRLSHPVETYGYRLTEPGSRRMLPERLEERGIRGPDVSRLQRDGELRGVRLEEVSVPRPGQTFAFVMDTRMCDGVLALAHGCDLLVVESTFLDEDAALAEEYGHLTAGQAGRAAAEAGVRSLVLTHFSQRYTDASLFARQARQAGYEGELTVAEDLMRVPVPKRRP